MIRPINTANKNNTIQNSINFQGRGSVTVNQHRLTPEVIGHLRELKFAPTRERDASGKFRPGFLHFWTKISDLFGFSFDELRQYLPHISFSQTNKDFIKLRHRCIHADELREHGDAVIVLDRPWDRVLTRGNLRGFAEETQKYLHTNGIIDRNGAFPFPARSITIRGGDEEFAEDLTDATQELIIKGGTFERPVQAKRVLVDGVENSALDIEADRAVIKGSRIRRFEGQHIEATDSIIIDGIYADKVDLAGRTMVKGNVVSKNSITCAADSEITVADEKRIITPNFSVLRGSRVEIDGDLGSALRPVRKLNIDGGHLEAEEVYADVLTRQNGGSLDAEFLSCQKAPRGVRFDQWRRGLGSVGPLI